jgi:phage terminase large subunit GpA-like protein
MRVYCPHCGEDRQIERTDRKSVYEMIAPRLELYVWFCNVCGREFIAPRIDDANR